MKSSAPTWIDEFVNTILQKPPLTEAPDQLLWSILEDRDSGAHFVQMNGESYRIVGFEPIGWGFSLALLGAQYEHQCRAREWPASLLQVLQREYGKARYHALALTHRHSSAMPIPVMTALEENGGNWHLLELAGKDDEAYWALATLAAHLLAERLEDASRFDDYGDFLTLGAPSIVQRHSTERIPKHISQKVIYDHRLCTHCLRCTTVCNEMRAIVTEKGARLLGPSEDFCTNCGLCQQRCSFLTATPKDELVELAGRRTGVNEGGPAFYFHGEAAENYLKRLKSCANGEQARFPYSVQRRLAGKPLSSDIAFTLPIAEQFQLDASSHPAFSDRKPLLVTSIGADNAQPQSLLIRTLQRVALVLQTASGTVEQQMARAAMKLGLDLTAVDCGNGGITFPANDAGKLFYQLGRPAITDQSLTDLWRDKKIDLILAPFADRIPAELHQLVMEQTGRQAQILSPHIRQALPFSRNPLLNELGSELTEIFISNPELMDAESSFARELLRDIPRNHALLHARYRNLAFASGHTACPSCAEAQVLAIPVYMAMAMSLARKEIPQVYFTCETGCMSETLNKVNEVSQKVPGGRTVFGGGFAFGEAVTMAQDHAVRMGYLSKGRRYVVSQGGDGGAVIGLPAWLNALRQQAFMISQRYANVLHFITITDTQVYSNTGGESSATSLVGMGTLTTPVGKFLLGNQKIQWTLINLAAELPGVLVASGHSANRVAMQEFWHLADRLGQSAIRWDVTPCPETGKFFGEDPDDLAEVMAHAGMLPEILFIGRFRKRIAPYHPEDRNKPYGEWSR
ncbi:MAG: hypothetical protein RBS57_03625, partial [Desulforhabdus sp.]|nr:hypothetical protein [Desulforhabdus sp.]